MNTSTPMTIVISLTLIIISGVFSLFNYAMVLCRKSRLEKEKGKKYKAVLNALEKTESISLSCRLWKNILRVLAVSFAAFGWFKITADVSGTMSVFYSVSFIILFIIFAIVITFLGDTLPKLLSRTKPEKIAAFLLPLINLLSWPLKPFTQTAHKFSAYFNKAVRTEIDNNSLTEEELQDELRNTLIEGEKSGIVEGKERTMVEGVFYLRDRPVRAFMTHRSEIQWFDINDPPKNVRAKALEFRQQQCFPVIRGNPDEIAGIVYLEDIILNNDQKAATLRAIMKKAQFVPETMSALKAFESFKQGQSNFLLVMDEYGGLAGILSIRALVEEIVGELSAPAADEGPLLLQEDGSWLADGTLNIDDAAGALGLSGPGEEGDFHTLAGLILHLSGELPKVGDSYKYQGYNFKVAKKDGNRIDKLIITKAKE